jgi:hypothetical protein
MTGVSTWAIDSAFRQKDGSFKNTTLVSQVGEFVYVRTQALMVAQWTRAR